MNVYESVRGGGNREREGTEMRRVPLGWIKGVHNKDKSRIRPLKNRDKIV